MRPLTQTLVGYLRSLLVREQADESSDRDLLQCFLSARDDDAFAALLRQHGPRVLNVARRVTGDDHAAEDVFQATFLLLARQAHAVRRRAVVGSWLSRTAFRLALRARRSQTRRAEREALLTPPESRSPLDELTARELLTVLDEELAGLPEIYRWPVVLCCLEGVSHEEAARHVDCSPRALRARLERGRKRLRQRLELRGLTLSAVLGSALVASTVHAVPSVLMETTLLATVGGGPATPAARTLTREAVRTMVWSKLKAVGAGVVVMVAVSLGLAMFLPSGGPTPAEPPGPKADPPPIAAKVDLHGDLLPDGAIKRLGTLRQRAVGARIAFTADGKTIVGVRGNRYVSFWDAETGKLRQTRELDSGSWGYWELLADGQLLATHGGSQAEIAIWDLQTGKRVRALSAKGIGVFLPFTFSADGKYLAAAGTGRDGQLLRAWRLADGELVFSQDVKTYSSTGLLRFTPDGSRLLAAIGDQSHGTYCWGFPGGEQRRLKPVSASPPETTAPLVADLDDPTFAKRQTAAEKLKELGPKAEPALRKVLEGGPSAESRRQVESLLEALTSPAWTLTAEEVREVRAVAVLSGIGGAESRRLLEELAKGVDSAPLTRASRAASQPIP